LYTHHNLGWRVVCRIMEIDSAWMHGVAVTRFCHSMIAYVEWPGRRPRTDNTRIFRLTSPPLCLARKTNRLPWRHLTTPGRGRWFHSSGTRNHLHAQRRRSVSLANRLSNLRRQTAVLLQAFDHATGLSDSRTAKESARRVDDRYGVRSA
jgi:hypothetical protein